MHKRVWCRGAGPYLPDDLGINQSITYIADGKTGARVDGEMLM